MFIQVIMNVLSISPKLCDIKPSVLLVLWVKNSDRAQWGWLVSAPTVLGSQRKAPDLNCHTALSSRALRMGQVPHIGSTTPATQEYLSHFVLVLSSRLDLPSGNSDALSML